MKTRPNLLVATYEVRLLLTSTLQSGGALVSAEESFPSACIQNRERCGSIAVRMPSVIGIILTVAVATMLCARWQTLKAGSLDNWTLRYPQPTPYRLNSVEAGNNLFVAVGLNGTVVTSSDGAIWTSQNIAAGLGNFLAVTFGNGLFVALGSSYFFDENTGETGYLGTILTSADGSNWITRLSAPDEVFHGVTHGNGLYVVVGEVNIYGGPNVITATPDRIRVSADGVGWRSVDTDATNYLRSVTYGNGTYVAVGGGRWTGTNYADSILTSADGTNWNHSTLAANDGLNSVTYGSGKFVAVGSSGLIFTSTDGGTWVSRNSTVQHFYGVTYGDGVFVIAGSNGTILRSEDGVNWTEQTSGTSEWLYGIGYGNGAFVAVGDDGTTLTSPNGVAWTGRTQTQPLYLSGITCGNGTFAAVGAAQFHREGFPVGIVLTSTNGTDWITTVSSNSDGGLQDVAYGNGRFVALGAFASLISTDGVNWATSRIRGESIAFGNNVFVVTGRGSPLATSTDGFEWTSRGDAPVGLVAYGNGRFVAAGWTSIDGTNWTPHTTNVPDRLSILSLTYGNGVFAATTGGGDERCFAGPILTSRDGITWVAHNPGTTRCLYGIGYGAGLFVAVGGGGDLRGEVVTSTDSANWTRQEPRASPYLSGVAFGRGTFVAVGATGTVGAIYQSGHIPSIGNPKRVSDGRLELTLHGEIGRSYRIQASTNLTTWLDLFTFSNNQDDTTFFFDTLATSYPKRFYRLVTP